MVLYQLGWMDELGMSISGPTGELSHPHLCLLSCESLARDYSPALPAAVAVELVYNYCLVHAEVQTGSPNSRRRPTVWWIWGPGQAINAGDGMHALGRLALMRLQERGASVTRVLKAMQLLDQSCLSMCEGQHMELVFQERLDVGVASYLKMATGKTGALMSCAAGLGALSASQDDAVVEAFKEYGKNLGIARQISGDIQDLWGSSSEGGPPSSLLNKNKLLPIVYALETADKPVKRELGTIYFKRVLEPPDLEHVTNILDGTSALEYCQQVVRDYCQLAMDALTSIDLSPAGRDELGGMCQRIIEWDS